MVRSPILLAATLKKTIIYCESMELKSKCVCSPGEEAMTVVSQTFPGFRVDFFSTEGRFLVSKTNNSLHEKVDVKRVATEIQENNVPLPDNCFPRVRLGSLFRPGMRLVNATFFRHLYLKCNFCNNFTSDIGALRYQCPHCRRANWPWPGLYIAQTRKPEQPMHSVWYRSAPTSYMITDDLESYPLKEMCHTSDFLTKQRSTDKYEEIGDMRHCLSPGVEEAWEMGRSNLTS